MVTVRLAEPNDAPAISAIHRSDIVTWKRWDAEGQAHLVPYEALSTYERWLNGGPWMDEATCRLHLEKLLASGGVALAAERDGQVLAEAEASFSVEPLPFGRNLNLSVIYTLRGHAGQGLGSALMAALAERALAEQCDTFMVAHAEARQFYAKHGLQHTQTWRRGHLPARPGQTQYTAEALGDGDYDAIRGWAMPIGRYQSARQEWERLQPGAEPDFEAWRHLKLERWRLRVRRSPAVLAFDESPRAPGTANVHLWQPPGQPISRQLLAAIRDRAARSSFSRLACFVDEANIGALGPEWRADGYHQEVWLKAMRALRLRA